jgi:hypothetical protein
MKKQENVMKATRWQHMITGFLGWTQEEITTSLNKLGFEGWQIVERGEPHHSWILKREIPRSYYTRDEDRNLDQ